MLATVEWLEQNVDKFWFWKKKGIQKLHYMLESYLWTYFDPVISWNNLLIISLFYIYYILAFLVINSWFTDLNN